MERIVSRNELTITIAGAIALLAFLVAACGTTPGEGNAASRSETNPPTAVPTRLPTDTAEKRLDSGGQNAAPSEAAIEDTSTPQGQLEETMEPPTPGIAESPPEFIPSSRTALMATDPGSVNLVSGDLQFVEFFAFW